MACVVCLCIVISPNSPKAIQHYFYLFCLTLPRLYDTCYVFMLCVLAWCPWGYMVLVVYLYIVVCFRLTPPRLYGVSVCFSPDAPEAIWHFTISGLEPRGSSTPIAISSQENSRFTHFRVQNLGAAVPQLQCRAKKTRAFINKWHDQVSLTW